MSDFERAKLHASDGDDWFCYDCHHIGEVWDFTGDDRNGPCCPECGCVSVREVGEAKQDYPLPEEGGRGENECPFEIGQRITDGEVLAIVTSRAPERFVCNAVMLKPQGGYDCGDPEDPDSWSTHGRINDWSRWVAFDPADVHRQLPKGLMLQYVRLDSMWQDLVLELDQAKARVEELEAEVHLYHHDYSLQEMRHRAEKAEASVAELERENQRLFSAVEDVVDAAAAYDRGFADAEYQAEARLAKLEEKIEVTARLADRENAKRREAEARVAELEGVLRLLRPLVGRLDTDTQCSLIIGRALDGKLVTCPDCNETTPRGWPCSCDDGRE